MITGGCTYDGGAYLMFQYCGRVLAGRAAGSRAGNGGLRLDGGRDGGLSHQQQGAGGVFRAVATLSNQGVAME